MSETVDYTKYAGCMEFVELINEFSATLDDFIAKKELCSVFFLSAFYKY